MSLIFKRLMSYVGKVKLEDLPKDWQKPVDNELKALEHANPIIKKAEIKYKSQAKNELIDCTDSKIVGELAHINPTQILVIRKT